MQVFYRRFKLTALTCIILTACKHGKRSSLRDIVQAEVQRRSSQKRPQNSRGRSGRKVMQTTSDVNNSQRKGRSSSKGINNRKRSQRTGRNQSDVANRRTTIGESHCQKTAAAEVLATERRLQNCRRKMAVLYG